MMKSAPAAAILAASLAIVLSLCGFVGQPMLSGGGVTTAPPPPPGNIACDFGPSTTLPAGQIGTDLAAAKFTHCVANLDFSDTSGAVTGGGYVMNNLATYVNECNGSPSTSLWRLYFRIRNSNGANGDNGGVPCNRLSLVTDTDGKKSLAFTVSASDMCSNPCSTNPKVDGFFLAWPLCGDPCNGGGAATGLALPTAKMVEWTFRVSTNTENATVINLTPEDGPFSSTAGSGLVGWGLDEVYLESVTNAGSTPGSPNGGFTSWDNYYTTCPPAVCSAKSTAGFVTWPDITHYHTWTIMHTGTGGTGTNAIPLDHCVWLDGTLSIPYNGAGVLHGPIPAGPAASNCSTQPNMTANELVSHNDHPSVSLGNLSSQDSGFGSTNWNNPVTLFVRQLRIFACTSYQGTSPTHDCTTDQTGGSLVFHPI